ncbi:MAG: SpoIIE family protein phosphatase [Clostridiales bacterium]|nr:SpoIIE family protein phosphatase [Clostridiales bacterium]
MKVIRTYNRSSAAQKKSLLFLSFMLVLAVLGGVFAMPSYAAVSMPVTLSINASGGRNGTVSVDPVYHSESCSSVLYDNTNGLPTSEANAIAQTEEGFIWIGGYSGLIRYDGNDFVRIDSTKTGLTSVRSLYVDHLNRLWIGTNDNGVVIMENDEFHNWDRTAGLPADQVVDLVEDSFGIVYGATPSGIIVFEPDMEPHTIEDLRVSGASIRHFARTIDGMVYCLKDNGDIFTLQDGMIIDYLSRDDNPIAQEYESKNDSKRKINSILPDPRSPGSLFVATDDSVIHHISLRQKKEDDTVHVEVSTLGAISRMEYINDQLWICARNGIGVYDEQGIHVLDTLPMNNSCGHVMTDYEGNLWFTSTRQGVMKIVPNRFMDIFERCNAEHTVVNGTCLKDDLLYLGTDSGLVVLDLTKNEEVKKIKLSEAKTASGKDLEAKDLIEYLNGSRIRSIIKDSKDRLWISTWYDLGLLCYDDGKLTAYTTDDGLYTNQIRTVVEREDGSFLVALTGGVNVIKNGRVTSGYSSGIGIRNLETLSVAEGFNGSIIVGTDGGGMYIVSNSGVRHIGREAGLSSEIIMRIKRDPTRNIYWLITSNSLSYMTEDYDVITIQNFPYTNNFDIYFNDKDEAWILSSNGLYVIPVEDLLKNEAIDPIHYRHSDGMPCYPTSNSYSELTVDGDLYIAGNTGSALVNINDPMSDLSDLRMAVPYIDVDGTRVYPNGPNHFTVHSQTQKLTVYPFIYNYSLIDPIVTYRLKRFDRAQTTIMRSELAPITYTNLPGGTYTFIMEVKDAMGHESRMLSITIAKAKAFYEEVWFYVYAPVGLLLAVFFGVRHYIRRRIRILEEKHHEESERQRMHSELNMGAQIQAAMLPPVDPPTFTRDEFTIFASMVPAKEVGGDFYDFFLVDEDHLGLVIADVSGKGIPAALFMMISKSILQSTAKMSHSPADILTKTNESICSNNRLDMFVTVWLGILELSTGKLIAANAGHEYPVLSQPGKPFELIKDKHGLVIGGMDGVRYKEYELQLKPGARLFVYTDGIPESTNTENELFGNDRMLEALNSAPLASPRELLDIVGKAANDFMIGAEQFDDMTMLCIEYKGPQTK